MESLITHVAIESKKLPGSIIYTRTQVRVFNRQPDHCLKVKAGNCLKLFWAAYSDPNSINY
jgi:hypothetical protein